MAEPRCPYCNAQGVKNISARPMTTAVLIFCAQCGAIFGVVPNPPQPRRLLKNTPADTAKTDGASAPPKIPMHPGRSAVDPNFGRGTRYMIIPDMDEEEIPHAGPKEKLYFTPGQPDPLPHRGIEPDDKPLTPEQSQAMMDYYYQHNRGTNRIRIDRSGGNTDD